MCCKTRLKKYDSIAEILKGDKAGIRTAAYLSRGKETQCGMRIINKLDDSSS